MTVELWGPVELRLATERATELIDVTDRVGAAVAESGIDRGSAQVFCPHTSCGLAITELEDGLHEDFYALMDELAPASPAHEYRHDDLVRRTQNIEPDERPNGWSHLRALLVTQPSVVLPVMGGRLQLGTWQRLFLVELDGPRPGRRLHVQAWGVVTTAG